MSDFVYTTNAAGRTRRFSKFIWDKMLPSNRVGYTVVNPKGKENAATIEHEIVQSMQKPQTENKDLLESQGKKDTIPKGVTLESLTAEAKEHLKQGRSLEAVIAFRAAREIKKTSYGTKMIKKLEAEIETSNQVKELFAAAKDLETIDPQSALEMCQDIITMTDDTDYIFRANKLIDAIKNAYPNEN